MAADRSHREPLTALTLGVPARSHNHEAVDRLVAAARRCFERHGVTKTRMAHIAEAAEMARPTAYEFVSGRAELVELCLIARADELAALTRERVGKGPRDPIAGFVEHIATMVEVCRDDREFTQTSEAMSRGEALRFLAASAQIHAIMLKSFRPRLVRMRSLDRLRVDMSDHEMVAWVQTCTTPLAVRPDLGPVALRHVIRTFVVPPFLADALDTLDTSKSAE